MVGVNSVSGAAGQVQLSNGDGIEWITQLDRDSFNWSDATFGTLLLKLLDQSFGRPRGHEAG